MQIRFCKNHPDRIAYSRCYQCKQSICRDCRKAIQHHYFCSYSCFLKFQWQQFLNKIQKQKTKIQIISQFILFAIIIIQFIYFQYRWNQIEEHQPFIVQDTVIISSPKTYLSEIQPKYNQLQLKRKHFSNQNLYNLNLHLKKGWILNIWRDKQPEISQLAKKDTLLSLTMPLEYGLNHFKIIILDQKQKIIYRDEVLVHYRRKLVEALRHSIDQVSTKEKVLSLTFDGGSDASHTKEILKILRGEEIHCTIFLTGKFMEKNSELVKQMLQDGHEIANHTYSHPHLTTYTQNRRQNTADYVDRKFVIKELLKTDSIFFQITNKHLIPFWRAPYGEYNRQILSWAAEAGFLHIRWTNGFDTFDWVTDESSRLYLKPEDLLQHFQKLEKDNANGLKGVIILMHLGSNRNHDHLFMALPELIQFIKEKGYRLIPISNLLESTDKNITNRQ